MQVDDSGFVIIVKGPLLIIFTFIVAIVLLFLLQKRTNSREKKRIKSQYERAILQSQIEIQNQTLQRVGQEIHDDVGQILSVLNLYLNIVKETNQQADIRERLEQTSDLVKQAIQSLRALSKSLDGFPVKDFGLVESISHELKRLEQTKKYVTELDVKGEPYSFGYNAEIILFRIVQELLNNAIKHAKATQITVLINYDPEKFIMEIKDNGIGFNYPQNVDNHLERVGKLSLEKPSNPL